MNYPLYLYKTKSNSEPDIYLEDEDTLIWAGIGGEVTLSVKDMRRWIKRIDSLNKKAELESELNPNLTEKK